MTDTSRISSTKTGQYDQVVAVSQDMVNSGLSDVYYAYPETQKLNQISVLAGTISGDLDVPQVKFNVKGTNLSSVIYRINFLNGTMLLRSDTDPDGKTFDISGWKLAFSVNMGLDGIPKTKPPYPPNATKQQKDDIDAAWATDQALISQIDVPGDYSAQRLYVDFTTARINEYSPSDSFFNGVNWDDPQYSGYFPSFSFLITGWLGKFRSSKLNTYGLAITVPDPSVINKVAPSFPPTALQFQTYPFETNDSAETIVEGFDGDAGRNCLCYLEMTGKRPLPATAMLPYSGNWTTKGTLDTRIDGSICMSKKIFFTEFLLPLLQQYGDDMQLYPSTATVKRDGLPGFRDFWWNSSYLIGYNPEHTDWKDSYFSFKENAPGMDLANFIDGHLGKPSPWVLQGNRDGYDSAPQAAGASWTFNTWLQKDSEKIDESTPGFPDWLQSHISSNITVHVVPDPGSNNIKVRGTSELAIFYEGQYRAGEPGTYNGSYDAIYWWGVDINLGAVDNGVLSCTLTDQVGHFYSHKYEENVAQIDNWYEKMENDLPRYFQDKQHITEAINSSLKGTGRFVFPGGGYFTMKDAVFNNNGDLLVTSQYNALPQGTVIDIPTGHSVPQQPPASLANAIDATNSLNKKVDDD